MQHNYFENKKIFQKTLATIIKQHRLACGKSISLICDEIGMPKSMWADLEKGIKDPQLSTLWRMCEGLEINTSKILIELSEALDENFSLTE